MLFQLTLQANLELVISESRISPEKLDISKNTNNMTDLFLKVYWASHACELIKIRLNSTLSPPRRNLRVALDCHPSLTELICFCGSPWKFYGLLPKTMILVLCVKVLNVWKCLTKQSQIVVNTSQTHNGPNAGTSRYVANLNQGLMDTFWRLSKLSLGASPFLYFWTSFTRVIFDWDFEET